MGSANTATCRVPWNKGKIVGQKAPFKLKDIWALRVRLQLEGRVRELALFNLGLDSKARLRSCQPEGQGRLPRRASCTTGDGDAAQDAASGAV